MTRVRIFPLCWLYFPYVDLVKNYGVQLRMRFIIWQRCKLSGGCRYFKRIWQTPPPPPFTSGMHSTLKHKECSGGSNIDMELKSLILKTNEVEEELKEKNKHCNVGNIVIASLMRGVGILFGLLLGCNVCMHGSPK